MLEDYLRRQDGVITLAQARHAGLSQDAVERRVHAGVWRRRSRGVYFVDDRPFTDAARIRAEVWSHGPSATACGLAAAWWHGIISEPPDHVDVTVPLSKSGRSRWGYSVRRRDLAPVDIVLRRNLRVTAIPLTVLEAAASTHSRAIMDSALQRGVSLDQLHSAQVRNARRHGATLAGLYLREASDGARSEAERLLIRLLRAAKISGWRANYPVCGYVVDVAFPKQKVAIEVDGWAFHNDRSAFQRDRTRQNRISLSGWKVLRFTWLDLTEHPQRVIAEIAAAIRSPR
ncbi:MAG TPA: type IV toxin-antitoxin system AbiEi family antitoxin domain-containing protein [Mycobacterium sp.]|nr:type IV toxin-antitoxin system AbiEi family antitoxin domain-containing protein [Mycobacterium sp.]